MEHICLEVLIGKSRTFFKAPGIFKTREHSTPTAEEYMQLFKKTKWLFRAHIYLVNLVNVRLDECNLLPKRQNGSANQRAVIISPRIVSD